MRIFSNRAAQKAVKHKTAEMEEFFNSRLQINAAGNTIKANKPVEPLLSRGAGYISKNYRLDPYEVAGRKYHHNQAINAQIADKKRYLRNVHDDIKNMSEQELADFAYTPEEMAAFNKKIENDIADLKWQRYGALDIASDYFLGSGKVGRNMLRTGTAIGLYGTASLGIRTIAGGTPTRDAKGNRDIAGVPFV